MTAAHETFLEQCEIQFRELEKSLATDDTGLQQIYRNTEICGYALTLLRTRFLASGPEKEQEIIFFKTIKPKFLARYIFWSAVYAIELNLPPAPEEIKTNYYRKFQTGMHLHYNTHAAFYSYYRSNARDNDEKYFTRKNKPGMGEDFFSDRDPDFSTSHDQLVAEIMANELLSEYLEEKINHSTPKKNISLLKWTASKAALVELIYALQASGVYNNGAAGIKEIALAFGKLFQVDLGNYYHVFNEIRLRKKSRAQLLDHLKERLVSKMDELDER
ncbi:MAG: RteC domain-containing protein [Bacteroidetes bacterium]|nr:RteC domain-containing protein [Bacteroidota bacterium]